MDSERKSMLSAWIQSERKAPPANLVQLIATAVRLNAELLRCRRFPWDVIAPQAIHELAEPIDRRPLDPEGDLTVSKTARIAGQERKDDQLLGALDEVQVSLGHLPFPSRIERIVRAAWWRWVLSRHDFDDKALVPAVHPARYPRRQAQHFRALAAAKVDVAGSDECGGVLRDDRRGVSPIVVDGSV